MAKSKLQKIFNKVAKHLLKQNKQCENREGVCLYKRPNGLKCAAGCLIPDSLYKKSMEGWDWGYDCKNPFLLKIIEKYTRGENSLIRQLQRIHDARLPETWASCLKLLAAEYKLSCSFIK